MTTFATEMVPPADNPEGSRPAAGQPRAFSRGELAFLIGVPLLWAILLLFHPGGAGDEIYLDVQAKVTRFLVVHIGMVIFIPLMAVVVYLLLRGVEGPLLGSAGSRLCPSWSSTAPGRCCRESASGFWSTS
jgi:hypothetical protein